MPGPIAAPLSVLGASLAGVLALVGLFLLIRGHLRDLGRANAALHDQRELLRATLVSIGDGVIATDPHGRVTFMNSVAEKLTGWSQAEAAGALLDRVFRIVNESTRQSVDNPALRR